ncbi:MAG: helicase-related protein, partial [Gudongella sp.]|nr:helicase-related protein [Gudongella sp.]
MNIKMLDNKQNGRVIDEVKDKIDSSSKLSIVSAYFTIYAYEELKQELNTIRGARFLLTEATRINPKIETKREYYIDHNVQKKIVGNEYEIKLRNNMNQTSISKECAEWLKDKVEIKVLKKPNPAHQRLIYIQNKDNHTSINGTVDFTTDGLGISSSDRLDMNTCITEFTLQYLRTFEDIWNDKTQVADIKEQILGYLRSSYEENTPEFIYFITLYNIFYNYLGELTEENIAKAKTGFKDTIIWNKLYKFQKDGALGIIDKLEKYNGCILADSVGLGKTFTALAVIKYYELRNDRVLVLAPKKLRENWTIYSKNDKRNIFVDDRFNYDVLNHTDLSRYNGYSGDINLETVNWSNYDLVVIDESHNFRNNNPRKDRETRYSRLMNSVIKKGVKTKVLMLSATPVNNRMNDIKNQIAFITEGNDNALKDDGIESIENTLRKAQMVFNKWSQFNDQNRTTDTFIEMMNMDYYKLLDTITLARSRKHIEKYYSIKEIGKFPERLKPINRKSEIDIYEEFPSIENINREIRNLHLSPYSPLKYLLPSKRDEYSKKYDIQVKGGKSVFRQTDREDSLINLMRVNLLKRLESSVHSFGMTLSKILREIDSLLEKIENKQQYIYEDINIEDVDLDDEDFEEYLIGNKVKVLIQDMDLIKWKQDLIEDKEKLEKLLIESAKVTNKRDAKLKTLKDEILRKFEKPINAGNRKILIFTAFADTARYLYENLAPWLLEDHNINSGLVTGTGSNQTTVKEIKNKDIYNVLTFFSPKSKERSKVTPKATVEIDVLIATDCISEGQNLQDCDYLINYDIHWNPVRIVQRFGRIDRIGSFNNSIQLVNFWPNMELDEYINLEARVTGKMVLMDISATGEENIIEFDEKNKMNDLEYRRKQLKQLQDEVIDLEEMAGGISITDLTLNDLKMDLMEYMKDNKKSLETAPFGMYS